MSVYIILKMRLLKVEARMSSRKMTQDFNTIQYCIDNLIPCFTFAMNATKKTTVIWGSITRENFPNYVDKNLNGFAIITGHTHVAIDFDEKKYDPPQEIKDALMDQCSAVEATPGGYHFWFKIDDRTQHLDSRSNMRWNGVQITGLDQRGQKGICYVAPSHYKVDGVLKTYKWIKGDLSTAEIMPDAILQCIEEPADSIEDMNIETAKTEMFQENNKLTIKIVPRTRRCLVKMDHIHSASEHSCIYLTKLKTCYSAFATCFSHGRRKLSKDICDLLVDHFWPNDETASNEYSTMKDDFEKCNFKVLDPVGFYSYVGNKWVFRERSQLKIAYENMFFMDDTPFIDKWLKDPHMKTYSRISFEPSRDPSIFVMPEDPPPIFVHESYTCASNRNAIEIFENLLSIVTNHKESLKKYVKNWLAHLLQKPMELPGVAIIFNGQKGVGKDTIGDFLGEYVIGNKNYQNYSNQSQYFDKHDESKAHKFLVKVEEINKKILEEGVNGEIFKSSLTSPILNFNPKNKQPYNLKNTMRVIGTSNNPNPVDVTQKERRYVISVVSPEKLGDSDYWCHVRNELFTPEGGLAVAQMLLAHDISQFNPRILPENDYLNKLQEDSVDAVQKFIEQIDAGEYTGSELYQLYKDYCGGEGINVYTNTKFSTQILFLTENGSLKRHVERKRTKKSINYIIN